VTVKTALYFAAKIRQTVFDSQDKHPPLPDLKTKGKTPPDWPLLAGPAAF